MRQVIRRQRWLLAILALYVMLAMLYSVANPIFEAPDEVWHYEYVRWLAEGKGLAVPEDMPAAPYAQEGAQPPLYYLLAAALTAPIPTDNAGAVIRFNPHAVVGDANSASNRNVMVHDAAQAWPWRGAALAAHLARFFSVLLGALTVAFTYGIARLTLPERRPAALLAASLVAFNPQFLFISAAVSNDNLATAVATLGVWWALRLVTGAAEPTWRGWLLLGVFVGLAALSKLSGLLLAGLAGLVIVLVALRQPFSPSSASLRLCVKAVCVRRLLVAALIVGGAALAVAGWWYWRNWRLYGDPLALNAMFAVGPQRTEPASLAEIVALAPGVWRSFWAVFGWFNVVVDGWVYWIYSLLAAMGVAGWGVLVARQFRFGEGGHHANTPRRQGSDSSLGRTTSPAQRRRYRQTVEAVRCAGDVAATVGEPAETRVAWIAAILLLVWIAAVTLSLARWAQINFAQGRLLFPAIGAVATLLAGGLLAWWPQRRQRSAAAAIAGGLALLAAVTPFVWIAPVYTPPTPLPAGATVPNPTAYAFGEHLRLIGYELDAEEAQPGAAIDLTLYWQTDAPLPADYSVFVHATDETDLLQAQVDSYPGGGLAPTSSWITETIVVDHYRLTVPATVHAPARLRIDVGAYDYATGERLSTPDGQPFTAGYVSVPPPAGASGLPRATSINFGDEIELVGYDIDRRTLRPGETLELTLWWETLRPPARDYKVFTHLLLPPDAVWAQDDQEPQEGGAPTSAWQPGDRIEDKYQLTVPAEAPPGSYSVEIGIYDPQTFERLRVGFSDKGVPLGWVRVER